MLEVGLSVSVGQIQLGTDTESSESQTLSSLLCVCTLPNIGGLDP